MTEGSAVNPAGLQFSVLLPFYAGDDPTFVSRAIQSVTNDQILKPSELVVVQDGPVGEGLEFAVAQALAICGVRVTRVTLERNQGLSAALNAGLEQCMHEVVARADADDISVPERFARQIPLIGQGYELVGSALVEFADDENQLGTVRSQPESSIDIERYARFHDPFNHPTVVYTKSSVQRVGGYTHLDLMEDYLLFAKMLHAGVKSTNLAEALVKYRVGAGAYKRRGGLRLLKSEWKLQREFRAMSFTSFSQYARNVAIRCGYRLVPEGLRKIAYRKILLRTGKRSATVSS